MTRHHAPRRPLPLFFLFALLGTARAADDEPRVPDLPIESYRLANGLKVVLHRDPAVPRVTTCVAYHVGSKNERAGRTGFAHFFEHMMFRGSRHVPNYDIPLREAGAESNAFTSEDMTVYYETVAGHYLERALYLEAERLAFLPEALDREKFSTEREVVKNERRQGCEDAPYGLADEAILARVFPAGHPYSWPVIGSMKDLSSASLEDLKRFFAEFYHPGNATLVVAGDFEPAEAKKWIDEYFGFLKAGPPARPIAPAPARAPASRSEQADEVALPRVYWTWPTVADAHPDTPALDILATILGGGDASRLHRALVLTGTAKDVAVADDSKEFGGLFRVDATAAEGKAVAEVEAALAAEVDRIKADGPTAAEVSRALAVFENAAYSRMIQPLARALTFGIGSELHGDPAFYREDALRHARVKADDVRRVARQYLATDKVVLVVQPVKPGEAEVESSDAGPAPATAPDAPIAAREPEGGPDWSRLPGPASAHPVIAPRFTRRRLSSGLDLWVAPWHTLPLAHVALIVPAGTADDPAGKAGLARYTGALIDKGTADLTAVALAEQFEALGGAAGVAVGVDNTTIGLSLLARNLDPALALLGRMLAGPRFDPADVDRERALLLTTLVQGPDEPSWIAERAFRTLLFGPGHPYGRPGDGRPEAVRSFTAADARAFHAAHIRPDGSTLIVAGDVDPDAVARALESALAGWRGKAATRPAVPAAATAPRGVVYLADKPGAVQSVIAVGRPWEGRTAPRYLATRLGNRVLGGDFLGRLNQNLREANGYTYGAHSGFDYRRSGSTWEVSTAVRADVTAEALREILAELDGLAGPRPIGEDEVASARDAEARSYPDLFTGPSAIASALEELAVFGLPGDELATFLARLGAVATDDIRKAMAELVRPSHRTVLVVGDRKAIEPKLKALGFAEIRVVTPDGVPAAK